MALGSSHWQKYGSECIKCHKTEPEVKLTRQHELKRDGKRTGKIIVMCEDCHKQEHPICVLCGKVNSVAKITRTVLASIATSECVDVDVPVCIKCYKAEMKNSDW